MILGGAYSDHYNRTRDSFHSSVGSNYSSHTGTPRDSLLSEEEEAAMNRLKKAIHRIQERVDEPALTQFNPYGLLTDSDGIILSGNDTPRIGSWEFFSSREQPLCMTQQAVEERRKELLLSLPSLLVRNRTISFPHSVEVQSDSPLWEHYNMIARPPSQTESTQMQIEGDDCTASSSSCYAPRGGLQPPSHVGTQESLSEHDLHAGVAFCGSVSRRTRHGFYAQVSISRIIYVSVYI